MVSPDHGTRRIQVKTTEKITEFFKKVNIIQIVDYNRFRLRLHLPSMSPFFVLFKNGLNAVQLHMTLKRSKVPLTKTVTLMLRADKPLLSISEKT